MAPCLGGGGGAKAGEYEFKVSLVHEGQGYTEKLLFRKINREIDIHR